jgi:hypothetical protein
MIARNVTMRLKANSLADFTQTLEKEVIPLLRKEKGFEDEITFIEAGGRQAVGISFWDKQENAEAYSRGRYAEVLKALGKVLDGTPQVQNWDVCNSTVHKIASSVAA